MDYFHYEDGQLLVENLPVRRIAEEVGTPCYIYSAATLRHHYKVLAEAFAAVQPLICYSIKANSCLAILKLLKELGAGFDVVSGGEIFRALRVGADPRKIVFAGVGKTVAEMRYALESGILLFNVESENELRALSTVALRMGKRAKVTLRLNPDVDPKTHTYITTGKRETKFGLDFERAERIVLSVRDFPGVELAGFHMHIGSQITTVEPYVTAARKVLSFIHRVRPQVPVEWMDIGGGFGIHYKGGEAKAPREFAEPLIPILKESGCRVALEPGRFIVGNAGILLTRLLYKKASGDKTFYICDAGMNDLIRPSLYQAYHGIWTVEGGPPQELPPESGVTTDVVGPVCESGDFFAKDRVLPDVPEGALLAIFSAGAYGFSMASNYNSRPLPAEVLVEGENYRVVRRRQSYQDLVSHEQV